ncbi:flagellar basal-body rod protein FlgG [Clostridium polynesiense]|uniref:flagellar basal-body rod protein FlgG n=1 Tax=Clostridium polynesiense TaxID=1325933 RepID=UPI000B022B0F|nr:flagellar basal-body rod protein FlgG [Clostridium polynesiense]
MRILWNGKSAMIANQEKLDSISNNLSNVNTTGYKKVNVSFRDLMSETLNRTGYPTNSQEAFTGTGVRTSPWIRDNTQGIIQETGLKTDIAIDGEGLFRVVKADGSFAYTRDGSFKIDSAGKIVDAKGNILSIDFKGGHNYNNTKFSPDNLSIDKSGEIFIKEGSTFTNVASIPLYNSIGQNSLISAGDSLYVPAVNVEMFRSNNADFLQGYLEGSNVDMAEEFTDMIITQRAFELGSRSVKTADEMWGMINNLRSR